MSMSLFGIFFLPAEVDLLAISEDQAEENLQNQRILPNWLELSATLALDNPRNNQL